MNSKFSNLKRIVALAAAVVLAACGGYTTVTLGGNVVGLVTDGLVLSNGSTTIAIPKNATTYTFPGSIDAHGAYDVKVAQQPQYYTCAVSNSPGRASGLKIDYVNVFCSQNTYTVGGTIEGLTKAGLVLINGADTITLAANATTFAFPVKVAETGTYGVTVRTQPTGQTCTVQNGTGTMGNTNVTSIKVVCS